MESKICSYTEKNARLQLVRVFDKSESVDFIEIRYNRKVILRLESNSGNALLSRYRFVHFVNMILVNRDISFVKIDTRNT